MQPDAVFADGFLGLVRQFVYLDLSLPLRRRGVLLHMGTPNDKRADRNEIGLLVRIYTEVGDSLSATEVIEEFARYGGAGVSVNQAYAGRGIRRF